MISREERLGFPPNGRVQRRATIPARTLPCGTSRKTSSILAAFTHVRCNDLFGGALGCIYALLRLAAEGVGRDPQAYALRA